MKRFVTILFILLLCNIVSLCGAIEESVSDGKHPIQLHSESVVLQQSHSLGYVLPETCSVLVVSAKVNQTHNNHFNLFLTHAGDSHLLNVAIALRNSLIVGFVRSVDKYIYALRRIII